MEAPATPENEIERLRSLSATGLLDTGPEERFDRLTRIARNTFGVKISLVSLVDQDRQWFKSRQGLEARETSRDISICGHAILQEDVFVVENARQDERFADNPLICGAPEIGFYAGAPVRSPDGYAIGTLCIIDDQARAFDDRQRAMLRDLADCVESEIARSQQRRYSEALERLSAIRNDTRSDPRECLRAALRLGCEYLKLPFGIISHIHQDTYTVLVHESPPDTLADHQQFELGDTYCSLTLEADRVLAIDHMGDSEFASHPCYQGFGLESYIGVPLIVGGSRYGTLNFSSPDPRLPSGFVQFDYDFLDLLASWVTSVLDRWEADLAASRVQHERRESERRLESVIEATHIGTWEWNVQSGAVIINARWAEMLGYSLEELEPISIETWTKLINAEDLVAADAALKKHFTRELDYYDVTFRMHHKQGSWVWIHARGRVMTWALDGSPLVMAGTHTDITEQKRSELKLKESEARLRALFELSPVGIALNDFDSGQFIEVNEALLAPGGYERDEFLNLSYWDVTPREYESQEAIQRETLLARGQYGPYEKEYIKKSGERYPVLLHGMLLEDAAGNRLIWSIIEDITERKRLAMMQREFVSTVSHELRTPLTAISAALSMLQQGVAGDLPSKARDMILLAARNSERLTELINDILDMEKLVAGKMPFSLEDCQLLPMLQQILEDNSAYAERFQVHCELDDQAPDAWVHVDPKRLIQVVINLLSNAIKFSPQHGTVRLMVKRTGQLLRLSVIDHGAGVPQHFRDRLFSAFAQADSSDSRKVGGTGLGLTISKKLMDRMNGRIGFVDTEGGGATFFIELPEVISANTAKGEA